MQQQRVYIVEDEITEDPAHFLSPPPPTKTNNNNNNSSNDDDTPETKFVDPSPAPTPVTRATPFNTNSSSSRHLPSTLEEAVSSAKRNRFGATIFSTMSVDSFSSSAHHRRRHGDDAGVDSSSSSKTPANQKTRTQGSASWTPTPPRLLSPQQQQQQRPQHFFLSATSPTPPSAPTHRPLCDTLSKIMEDTQPLIQNAELEAKNSHRNIMTSQVPLDKEMREAEDEEGRQLKTRVGIHFCDAEHLQHLPAGHKGTKTFVVPQPPDVLAMRNGAARALELALCDVQVGYRGVDGSGIFFHYDEDLRKYLSDQPRLVPFVQAFVTGRTEGVLTVQQQEQMEWERMQLLLQEERVAQEAAAAAAAEREEAARIAAEEEEEASRAADAAAAAEMVVGGDSDDTTDTYDDDDDGIFQKQTTQQMQELEEEEEEQEAAVPKAIVRRPASAPASRVPQHRQQQKFEEELPNKKKVTNVVPAPPVRPSSAVLRDTAQQRRQQEHFQQQQQQQPAPSTENRVEGAARVAPSASSERGLAVLPPLPSSSSIASAWRLGVDSTCVSAYQPPPTSTTARSDSVAAAHLRPLYSRPSSAARFVPGPSSGVSSMGTLASNMVNLFVGHGSVNEDVVDKIYGDLCHQTAQVLQYQQQGGAPSRPWSVASSTTTTLLTGATTTTSPSPRSPAAGAGGAAGGVLPSVLLDYLDCHCADFGDKRLFERTMGTMLLRRLLSRDHVALVLLRVARE